MSSYREEQIAYETKSHWVLEVKPGYFEIYKTGITHSTRCGIIGPYNEPGRARSRAIEECDRLTLRQASGSVQAKSMHSLSEQGSPKHSRGARRGSSNQKELF